MKITKEELSCLINKLKISLTKKRVNKNHKATL